jgi:hypothetical protein
MIENLPAEAQNELRVQILSTASSEADTDADTIDGEDFLREGEPEPVSEPAEKKKYYKLTPANADILDMMIVFRSAAEKDLNVSVREMAYLREKCGFLCSGGPVNKYIGQVHGYTTGSARPRRIRKPKADASDAGGAAGGDGDA